MYTRRASEYSSHMSSYDERESPEKTTIVEEEELSVGDGQPQPATENFKAVDVHRSDTPETYLTDLGDKPDITLFCDQCKFFIDIRQLKHHRAYHNALLLLNFKGNSPPETSEQLLKKRHAVLKKMKKDATEENPLLPKQIQEVNDAYELLKSDVEDTFDACRQVKETVDTSCRGTALNCNPDCVYALGMCSSPNAKWKTEMEDTKIYQDCFGEDMKKCYMGLFDGYHGRFSAEVAASLLHKMLLHEMMKFDASLSLGPKPVYDADTDISHHRFVFGSAGKLDGQTEKKGKAESAKPGKAAGLDADHSGAPVSIQQDDDDLTRRIIELCEHKYRKLLEEMSSPPPAKLTRSMGFKTERSRHPEEDKIFQAFEKSYQLLDILLSYGKDEWSKVRWSGCSALSLVIESVAPTQDTMRTGNTTLRGSEGDNKKQGASKMPEKPETVGFIHLANAGDARALLIRGNRPYRLSKDHTPSNIKEHDRVIRQGGTFSTSEVDCRLNGVLSTTRGLGNHGDPALKSCVLVEPHSSSVPIDKFAQFIVMATRGVWEILSDQEVASLLMRMLPENQIPPPTQPSSSLALLLQQGASQTPTPAGSDKTSATRTTGDKGQRPSDDKRTSEKGADDAAVSEKTSSATKEEGRRINADMKTEVGSHFGDVDDQLLSHRGGHDTLTLPEHSRLQLGGQGSPEEYRRELAKAMAEYLVQAALLAGSRNNITVMVALLPGCGI
ncbi:protein phosphatase 2C-like domain-containing protein 1 isoform X2 [Littorina saxatilis]|uniref:PPM-type phosphatase domain-containing protein n=1 Tax=Littorina saxatilis TaxID=31220 RepID=A0AAN9BX46_9CAEN